MFALLRKLFGSFSKKKTSRRRDAGSPELQGLSRKLDSLRAPALPGERGAIEYARLKEALEIGTELKKRARTEENEDAQIQTEAALMEIKERLEEVREVAAKSQRASRSVVNQAMDSFNIAANRWDATAVREAIDVHQESLSVLEGNKGWLTVPREEGKTGEWRQWDRYKTLLTAQLSILSDAETNNAPTGYSVSECEKHLAHLLERLNEEENLSPFLMSFSIDVTSLLSSLVNGQDFLVDASFQASLESAVSRVSDRFSALGAGPPDATSILERLADLSDKTDTACTVVRVLSSAPEGMTEEALLSRIGMPQPTALSIIHSLSHHGIVQRSRAEGTTRLALDPGAVPDWWLASRPTSP